MFFSTPLFTPPGVSDGLKDTERLPDTVAAAGTTSFCTGGTDGSSLFLFAWKFETSRSVRFSEADRGDETVDGILFASARGLDMRSRDCRMRLAVALVTPQG